MAGFKALILGVAMLATLLFGPPAMAQASGAPSHYDVRLKVDVGASSLEAQTTITLAPQDVRPEQAFSLGAGYRITEAQSDHAVVETPGSETRSQRITVRPHPGYAGPVVVRLSYAGPLQATGAPPLNAISRTLVELNLDGGWVPIRTDYTLLYSSRLTIEGLPADAVTASQGVISTEQGRVVITRDQPDFDMTFVASPGLRAAAEEGFELYAADPDDETSLGYRRQGGAALDFLERWFGPIPGRPIRVVVVDRERVSGYARRGYVVVTKGRGGGEEGIGKFIAHEFAHSWSPAADPLSEHHWLIESTAEYVSLRYVEAAFGAGARDARLAEKATQAIGTPPILGGGRRDDATLYGKGCILLFELERRIGRPAMDALMAEFARERPATTPLFLALLARHAGADEVFWFETALRT